MFKLSNAVRAITDML